MIGQLEPPRFAGTSEQLEALERAFSRPVPAGGLTEIIGSVEDERTALRQQLGSQAESAVVPPAGHAAVSIDDGAEYGANEPKPGRVNREQPGWRFVGRAKGLGDP